MVRKHQLQYDKIVNVVPSKPLDADLKEQGTDLNTIT